MHSAWWDQARLSLRIRFAEPRKEAAVRKHMSNLCLFQHKDKLLTLQARFFQGAVRQNSCNTKGLHIPNFPPFQNEQHRNGVRQSSELVPGQGVHVTGKVGAAASRWAKLAELIHAIPGEGQWLSVWDETWARDFGTDRLVDFAQLSQWLLKTYLCFCTSVE